MKQQPHQRNTTPVATLMLALALFGMLLAPLANANTGDASFIVSLQRYEPAPVRPGEIVDAWIQITNTGRTASNPVTLTIEPSYPFTPASASDERTVLGSIPSGSSFVARVRLAVDTAAGDGTYTLPIRVSSGSASSATSTVEIQVRSPNAVLSVSSARTTPSEIVPGSPAELSVVVRNTQASVLRDVSLALDLDGTQLSTLGTTTKQTVARLDGTSETTFRFRLVADPEAQSGVVRVPLTFTFTATDGREVVQRETTGVLVHAAPNLNIVADRVTRSADGKETIVLVRIVNKGLSQIKFGELEMTNGDGYVLGSGRRVAYVGNIDSDDFQTAEFIVVPNQDAITLRGTLSYSDALNTPMTMPVEVAVTIPPKASGTGFGAGTIIVILLVLGGCYFLWKRRTKKNERR